MSFLKIDGITIPVAASHPKTTIEEIGQRGRSLNGQALMGLRNVKRAWDVTTTPMGEADAFALVKLLIAHGAYFPLSADANASNGYVPYEATDLNYANASMQIAVPGTPGSVTYSTAGSHDFVCPTGVTSLRVQAWGAGGGGAGGSSGGSSGSGDGGGGSAYAESMVSSTPGTHYAAVVGAAGAAGGSAGSGGNGGNSTFSSTVVVAAGGKGGWSGGGSHGHGGQASDCTGDITYNGGDCGEGGHVPGGGGGGAAGSAGDGTGDMGQTGGAGGSPDGGAGGNGGNGGGTGQNGFAGNAPGGGGGGGGCGSSNTTGGAGAAGKIIISYTAGGACGTLNIAEGATQPFNAGWDKAWSVSFWAKGQPGALAEETLLCGSNGSIGLKLVFPVGEPLQLKLNPGSGWTTALAFGGTWDNTAWNLITIAAWLDDAGYVNMTAYTNGVVTGGVYHALASTLPFLDFAAWTWLYVAAAGNVLPFSGSVCGLLFVPCPLTTRWLAAAYAGGRGTIGLWPRHSMAGDILSGRAAIDAYCQVKDISPSEYADPTTGAWVNNGQVVNFQLIEV